nr:hypothetical protein [Phycisphaerae bacterium]
MNSSITKACALLLACSILAGLVGSASAGWKNPKAQPHPKAKPQRRTAAESLPPLPLPATPLRRSERKRQPSPPNLVGMVNFSERKFVQKDGKRVAASAFPTTVIDIERLISYANSRLNIRYRYVPIQLAKFSWDPRTLPLLYVTGWTPMPKLSDDTIVSLRRYLLDGGTLVVHAQCGREEFRTTALAEIR